MERPSSQLLSARLAVIFCRPPTPSRKARHQPRSVAASAAGSPVPYDATAASRCAGVMMPFSHLGIEGVVQTHADVLEQVLDSNVEAWHCSLEMDLFSDSFEPWVTGRNQHPYPDLLMDTILQTRS